MSLSTKVTRIIIDIFAYHSCLQNLKNNPVNKRTFLLRDFLPLLLFVLIISSCNPTKYVPEDQTLLDENIILLNKEGVKKKDLLPYLKQKAQQTDLWNKVLSWFI